MVAVQGLYENGSVKLTEKAPVDKANVIVIFPGEPTEKMAREERSARKLFDEFTGSVSRVIDEKAERLGALDEKYAGLD